jgi:hypothetical protein
MTDILVENVVNKFREKLGEGKHLKDVLQEIIDEMEDG